MTVSSSSPAAISRRATLVAALTAIGGLAIARPALAKNNFFPNVVIKRDLYLAINDFTCSDIALAAVAAEITHGLRSRLAVPPISLVDLSDEKIGIEDLPRFATLRARRADVLLIGHVGNYPRGMKVQFRVWTLYNERKLAGLQYLGARDAGGAIADGITVETYDRLRDAGALKAN